MDDPQIGTVDSHYIQKARLKEFSWKEGNHHKIVVVDLLKKKIGSRNIESAFYQHGLYSDEVETEMNEKIEKPGMKIFGKAYKAEHAVILTRKELEEVKKYLLVQLYRNPSNMSKYSPNWEGDYLGVNKRFKNDAEAYQHVSDEIHEICSKSLSELMMTKDRELFANILGIRQVSTLFVRSPSLEFVINDLGSVCERHEYHGHKKDEIKAALTFSLEREVSDAEAEDWISHHQYHDNFTFYPISSRFGIITLSPDWTDLIRKHHPYKIAYQGPDKKIRVDVNYSFYDWVALTKGYWSNFIRENYVPCTNIYESPELYDADYAKMDPLKVEEMFAKHASPDDKYIYPVMDISLKWAEYLNRLTINEAKHYFGFGSVPDAKISISNYEVERLLYCKPGEAKHDLSWVDPETDWKKPLP